MRELLLTAAGAFAVALTAVLGKRVGEGAIHVSKSAWSAVLRRVRRTPPAGLAATPPPSPPWQVPAVTATFCNRLAELSALERLLGRQDVLRTAVGLLVGLPGVGKTTLACRWVAQTKSRFPGGALFVDYQTVGGPREALTSCLRSMGVQDGFLPVSLAELTGLFRTRTAESPMLVLVAGAREPAQVELLVPAAPGSAVVVATQYRMDELVMAGAHLIPVEPLDDAAALELLASACGEARIAAEPDAARTVIRLCGGLALALRAAAARLALDPTLSVAAFVHELTDEAHRLAAFSSSGWTSEEVESSVAAAFSVGYAALPAPAQRLYRDLGTMPVTDLTEDLMLGVSEDEPATTRTALAALVRANLLQRTRPGRYEMHQLVRLHATHQAMVRGDDRAATVARRVVHHYLPRVAWADWVVMGERRLRVGCPDPDSTGVPNPFTGPDAKKDALGWLEDDRPNLLPVLRAALTSELYAETWWLAIALNALYFNHRHLEDWIEAARLGVDAARRRGRRDVEAQLRSAVSRAYTDLGDLERAGAELEAARRAAAGVADAGVEGLVLQASICEFDGRYLERLDLGRAVESYDRCIALNVEAEEWRGAALGRYFRGCALEKLGRSKEALAQIEQALAELRGLGDERMAHRCELSLGRINTRLGNYAEARQALTAAADGFAAAELWHYEFEAREALADLAARAGLPPDARKQLLRALEIEQTAGGTRVARVRAALAALN